MYIKKEKFKVTGDAQEKMRQRKKTRKANPLIAPFEQAQNDISPRLKPLLSRLKRKISSLKELCKIRPILNSKCSNIPYRFPKPIYFLQGIDGRKQNRHVILLCQIHTSLSIIKIIPSQQGFDFIIRIVVRVILVRPQIIYV